MKEGPYHKRSKDYKNKENYKMMTTSDMTSQDVFYTTETDARRENRYTNRQEDYLDDYDTYDSRFFEKYNYSEGNPYTYDDYTTSYISYEDKRRKPRFDRAQSEFSYSRRRSHERPDHGRRSPTRDYEYFRRDRSESRKRSKRTRSPHKHIPYDLKEESEVYLQSRSPKRNRDYIEYYEEPEENHDYERYFERTKPRERSSGKRKRKEKFDQNRDEKQRKKRVKSPKTFKNYQVYAYEEPKEHAGVFKAKQDSTGDTLLPSEIEVKSYEYPILGLKDPGDKGSDTVYFPVLVLDKNSLKSGSPAVSAGNKFQPQLRNIHVFAANTQAQRNIFQTLGDVSSQNTTQTHPNYIPNQQTVKTSISKENVEISSGARYAGSLLGSLLNNPEFNSKPTKESVTKGNPLNTSKNNDWITYQVNVDIDQDTKNVFGTSRFKEELVDTTGIIEFKEIEDPLHDDYPVTKDYIKVSDNVSEQRKSKEIPGRNEKEKRKSTVSSAESGAVVEVLTDGKISQSIADSLAIMSKKSIMKKNMSLVSNENGSKGKRPLSLRKSIVVDGKRGSTAIASHLSQDKEKEVSESPAKLRLTTVDEDTEQRREETRKKSTIVPMLKNLSDDRRSRIEVMPGDVPSPGRNSTVGYVLGVPPSPQRRSVIVSATVASSPSSGRKSRLESIAGTAPSMGRKSRIESMAGTVPSTGRKSRVESVQQVLPSTEPKSRVDSVAQATTPGDTEIPRLSVATTKKSVVSQRPSKISLLRTDSKSRKSRSSAVDLGLLQKQPSTVYQEEPQIVVETGDVVPIITPTKEEDSDEALRRFTKEVFGMEDYVVVESQRDRTSTLKRGESVRKSASLVSLKESPLKQPSQTLEAIQQESIIKQASLRKSVAGRADSRISSQIKTQLGPEVTPIGADFWDEELVKESPKLDEEEIISVIDMEQQEKDVDPAPLKKVKSKRSFKNLASALANLGRKKSTISRRPYIQVKPTSPTASLRYDKSISQVPEENNNLFVKSIQPTSTLYKNEQKRERTPTLISKKSKQTKEAQLKPSKSKSVSTLSESRSKSKLSRWFSRSKTKLKDKESDDEISKSKTKLKKPRSKKTLWGILKRSKSKSPSESSLPPPIPPRYEEVPKPAAPLEKPAESIKPEEKKPEEKKPEEKKPAKVEKPCDCVSKYIILGRACGFFLLGTTLHEEIMNLITVLSSLV